MVIRGTVYDGTNTEPVDGLEVPPRGATSSSSSALAFVTGHDEERSG
jgi:hypothetical protein